MDSFPPGWYFLCRPTRRGGPPPLRVQAALSLRGLSGGMRFADLLTTDPEAWKVFQKEWEGWLKDSSLK